MAQRRGVTNSPKPVITAARDKVKTIETDIAIIGCGVAGLYCGLRLAETGKRNFLIAEETNHIGGRIWSTRILDDGAVVPDDTILTGDARSGFKYKEKLVEFCAEFGPMRIELDLQTYLKELILDKLKMDAQLDLEPFPPYQSPTSAHDPKYELKGEEREQETPLDLLKLAVVRVLGRLRSREKGVSAATEVAGDIRNRAWLDRKLGELIQNLSCAMATRQADWKGVLSDWVETLIEPDYQNIRQYGIFDDGTVSGTPLWNMGFWNLLSEVLSHHAVMKIRDLGTFYHLIPENPNAAEWLIFWLRAFRTSERLIGVRGGMQRIAEHMAQRIGQDRIVTGRKLVGIAADGQNKVALTFDLGDQAGRAERWTARHVILALPSGPLQELAKLNERNLYYELHRDLAAVFGFPLLKFFLSVKERWWNEDAASTNRYATMIPTRELHYKKSSLSRKGLVLVYTDRPATTFWSNYISHNATSNETGGSRPQDKSIRFPSGIQGKPELGPPVHNPRLINKALQYLKEYGVHKKLDDVEFYGIRDWGRKPYLGAAHAWFPERKSWEFLKRLSAFPVGHYSLDDRVAVQEPLNLHVCGEAYSDYQAFIEGALRSAEHVLHTIDRRAFRKTPTPWLCSKDCFYSKPNDEDERLRGNRPCANNGGA